MTTLSIAGLTQKLPDEAITWAGFGEPVRMNISLLTGEALTPESSALELIIKLLSGLYQLQTAVNITRLAAALEPITLVTRMVDGGVSGNPVISFTVAVEIDLNASLNNLIDPTV